ncbi:DUF6912 family protein [Glycomyces harbinensis]|uniref:Uncharacterized protein n=1 Tax=Glycomyces harbinensis TaxID=58114 RepID=A0A1G6UVM6_9ACTN|nr:hypothetical protein [Glycomyces harbinensis]SDD44605.1 hypothetical protein SAMN05216270_10449 [Glycomyces harbinensis]
MARIYIPADVAMLAHLAEAGEVRPVATVHAVTAWLTGAAPGADVEDLEYTAFADAATASVGLLAGQVPRRVVISADVPEALVIERAEGTEADFEGGVSLKQVAAIHVDDAAAAEEIAAELASGSPDLGLIEANVLDWYAPEELQELLAALALGAFGMSRP